LYQGFVDVSQGLGTVVTALAAILFGEKVIPTRSPIVATLSCLLGAILYRLIIAMALRQETLGLESYMMNLITGLLVVGLMMLTRGRRHEAS
jgi:putative ABC transport system permease protein